MGKMLIYYVQKFSLAAGGHFSSRSHCSHVDCIHVRVETRESLGLAFYVFYVAMQIRPSTVSIGSQQTRIDEGPTISFRSILTNFHPGAFFGSEPIYSRGEKKEC